MTLRFYTLFHTLMYSVMSSAFAVRTHFMMFSVICPFLTGFAAVFIFLLSADVPVFFLPPDGLRKTFFDRPALPHMDRGMLKAYTGMVKS